MMRNSRPMSWAVGSTWLMGGLRSTRSRPAVSVTRNVRLERPPASHPIVIVLAAHLGAAFDHVRQLDELRAAQREVVHRLQEAVRPPRPDLSGTELGVHYLAADPRSATGGDLYDWQVLPDGGLH